VSQKVILHETRDPLKRAAPCIYQILMANPTRIAFIIIHVNDIIIHVNDIIIHVSDIIIHVNDIIIHVNDNRVHTILGYNCII